jgi:aldehyde dehydrogenase (NAD+)
VSQGFFCQATVFADVKPNMRIFREEIFGPVLSIVGHNGDEDAIRLANDTPYGLAAYVNSGDQNRAREIAKRIRAGTIHINFPLRDPRAPFGGYKMSGNGREWGEFGLREYLETKGVVGFAP